MRQLVCTLSLAVLAALPSLTAFAAEPDFQYAVELQAPETQRALLETHLDLYRWRDNERMDETQLRRLVRLAPAQIGEFLATEGFYSPTIDSTLEQRNDQWIVKLQVEPGEPVRVSGLDLKITGAFDDGSTDSLARLQKIRDDWPLPPGALFRHAEWEAAKRGALKALLLDRYPAAKLGDSQATVNPKTGTVALQLTLDSGPAFTLGSLKITGLKRYPATIVERLNPIPPGTPYSQGKLLDLQSRLQDSLYFAAANVSVAPDPALASDVPVEVAVTENPSQKIGLGIGMSTDTGLRGQIDYRDLNFLDRAWRLSGALKLDEKRQSLGSELQLPLSAEGDRDSFSALMERTDIQGEVIRKLVLGSRRSRIQGRDESSYGIRYVQEQQDIAGIPGDRRSALAPSYVWSRRSVDNLLYPTQGYLINLQTDVASKALLSDRDFLRAYGRAVYFQPLGKQDQLIVRGELGAVAAQGSSGIPSDFLFRTGGDQTVRGYAYQSLGVQEGGAIVGGLWLAVASVEYVRWLTPKWGAAAFFDQGNAADSLAALNPVRGYGAGARWKSPIGPLNFDIAYGEQSKQVRLHFSVGFSF